MLKRKLLGFMMVTAVVCLLGCSKEFPGPSLKDVSNLTVNEGNKAVILNWKNPDYADFAKVVISYDETNKIEILKEDTVNNLKEITGLTNDKEYTFNVKAVDTNGNETKGIVISATPGMKMGFIAYTDGTYYKKYAENKTPFGIVINTSDYQKNIIVINLKQASEKLSLCSTNAEGKTAVLTSLDDSTGSGNWQIYCNSVSDESNLDNYPAFKYCLSLNDGGKTWYLPAKDELSCISGSRLESINNSLKELKENDISVDCLIESYYWSSSKGSDTNSTKVSLKTASVFTSSNRIEQNYVRAVTKIITN